MNNDSDDAPPKRKTMTAADKKSAYSMMVMLTGEGKPPRAVFSNVAACFSVHRSTCMRLWKQIQKELENVATDNDNNNDNDVINNNNNKALPDSLFETKTAQRRKGKFKHDRDEIKRKVKEMPFSKRRRTRQLAAQLEIPQSTIMYIFKQNGSIFKRHSNSLKPKLTDDNQRVRLQFALSKIDLNTTTSTRTQVSTPKFLPLFDEVHVDEKLFFLCRDGESYVVVSDEEEPPKRHVSHKSHVTKVMFLCAMARPRRLPNGSWWDGKIGIWPIGEYTLAQRSSVNRPAGTEEFKKETIDRDKCRTMMLNEVVPAIQSRFPTCEQN